MNILLTGSRGNLGQALMRQGTNHTFKTLDRGEWDQLAIKLRDADVVIHAASDLLTPVAKEPQAVMDANIMTTARLLEAMAKVKSKARLEYISSCAVYGQSQVTREDVPPAPISVNGMAKLVNEKMIQEFCGAHGFDFQILRLFNTFGGRDRFSILAHLKRAIREKVPFTMFNEGVSQRDFVHVEDAANLLLKLISFPVKHRMMNIGCGETTRIADIIEEARNKYPSLEIKHATKSEAEYSRADVVRLREVFPDFEFRKVLDFIRAEF